MAKEKVPIAKDVMSVAEALGVAKQVMRNYKAFKRIEDVLRTVETARSEIVALEERRKRLTLEVEKQEEETAAVVSKAKAEQEAFRSKVSADRSARLEAVAAEVKELESKFAAKLTPLQAEEVRLEKSVEKLTKEYVMLSKKIQDGEKKLGFVQQEMARIKASF